MEEKLFHYILQYIKHIMMDESHECFVLEGSSFLSGRRDLWQYFCKCLVNRRNIHDGLKIVKANTEVRGYLEQYLWIAINNLDYFSEVYCKWRPFKWSRDG